MCLIINISRKNDRMKNSILLNNKIVWIIGKSGAGKTTFLQKELIPRWKGPVYVKTKDETEWNTQGVELLKPEFELNEISDCPTNSLFFFDDYVKGVKDKDFQATINFTLRHQSKTLIIAIHDIYKTGLYNSILQSNVFFLAYCSANLKFLQIIDKQFNTSFRQHFQANYSEGVAAHHIAFLNTDSLTFYPAVNLLFQKGFGTMFSFDEYTVHLATEPCGSQDTPKNETIPLHLYPKWEKRGKVLLQTVRQYLDDNNYILGSKVAVLDFLKMAVNKASLPAHLLLQKKKFTNILKKMKKIGLKFPESIVLNNLARKYIC